MLRSHAPYAVWCWTRSLQVYETLVPKEKYLPAVVIKIKVKKNTETVQISVDN